MPDFLNLRVVKRQTKAAVSAIFDHWGRLNWIVQRYEPTLQKRWAKRNGEQRKKILLAAWPNMPANDRPDFDAIQRERDHLRRSNSRYRDAYLFPYINQEDLCKPKNLLLMFHSRGRNLPEVFAFHDLESHRVGCTSGVIVPGFINEYTMVLTGRKTRATYGQILSWDEHPDAFDMMLSGRGAAPGEGLIVLEIQERLLKFLVRCAELLLQDMKLDQALDVLVVPAPSLSSIGGESNTEWRSLADAYAEAPYHVPAQLDFSRLKRLAIAKRGEAEDHIWALREDPGYFKELMEEEAEHRPERVPTPDGKFHATLERPIFYRRVMGSAITDAYGAFVVWNLVVQKLNGIEEMRNQYGTSISPSRSLPEA
jgi:hypothetical protein